MNSVNRHSDELPSAETDSGAAARCDVTLRARARILHGPGAIWQPAAGRFRPAADANGRYRAQATQAFHPRTKISSIASEHILFREGKKQGQKCQQSKSAHTNRFIYSKRPNGKKHIEISTTHEWAVKERSKVTGRCYVSTVHYCLPKDNL